MKIWIVGCSGSGKSHLTRKLTDMFEIEPYHLDDYYWQPDWKKTEPMKFTRAVREIIKKDSWIIDGMYQEFIEEMADDDLDVVVVFLNTPRFVAFRRILKRTLTRIVSKETICNNNVETIGSLFGKESILAYALRSYKESVELSKSIVKKHNHSFVVSNSKEILELIELLEDYKWNERLRPKTKTLF